MLGDDIRDTIQKGYRRFLTSRELMPRTGQKQMIAAVAHALSNTDPAYRISAVEAATGTGKTVAYLIAALPVARAAKKTVVVATGTVALQEQLINKDIFSPSKDGKYYYTGGWHIKAIYAIFVGFVFASATIWNVNLMFLQPFSWLIGTISSSLTYYFLNND